MPRWGLPSDCSRSTCCTTGSTSCSAFGGPAAARSLGGARTYARAVGLSYALLVVMGLILGLNTLFGLVPLYGHDVWLHALLSVVGLYFGFMHREDARTVTAR